MTSGIPFNLFGRCNDFRNNGPGPVLFIYFISEVLCVIVGKCSSRDWPSSSSNFCLLAKLVRIQYIFWIFFQPPCETAISLLSLQRVGNIAEITLQLDLDWKRIWTKKTIYSWKLIPPGLLTLGNKILLLARNLGSSREKYYSRDSGLLPTLGNRTNERRCPSDTTIG